MKKLFTTIMGTVAMMATLTSCGMVEKVEFEEPIKAAYNIGYCCPTEPVSKQLARKIKESGHAENFNDIEYVKETYDVFNNMKDTEMKLKFKNVNGVENYTTTIHIKEQNTWVLPSESIEETVTL